jgi:hypothetical protein
MKLMPLLLLLALTLPLHAADEPRPFTLLKSAVADLRLTGNPKVMADKLIATTAKDIERSNKAARTPKEAALEERQHVRYAVASISAYLTGDQKRLFKHKMESVIAVNVPRSHDDLFEDPPPANTNPLVTRRIEQGLAGLKFTTEQDKKIAHATSVLQHEENAFREEPASPAREKKALALHADVLRLFKPILTPDQFERFQNNLPPEPLTPSPGSGIPRPVPFQRLEGALKDLHLNKDQQTKVNHALTEARKAVGNVTSPADAPTPEAREKFLGAFREFRARLAKILTDEQREKLKAEMRPK